MNSSGVGSPISRFPPAEVRGEHNQVSTDQAPGLAESV
jgi:hypothetical protein